MGSKKSPKVHCKVLVERVKKKQGQVERIGYFKIGVLANGLLFNVTFHCTLKQHCTLH